MKILKALITAAGAQQRQLPLQTLIDQNRQKKTVLEILIAEIQNAGIKEIGIVIQEDDRSRFEEVLKLSGISGVSFISQNNQLGYGHALLSAKDFLNNEPFLHLVGDHLYVNPKGKNIARGLIELAQNNKCSVSSVQATRENQIGNYGTIGAERIQNENAIFKIKEVKEKPTPTYAEQNLLISGLRTGYYLCFYGMHVFTPSIINILQSKADANPNAILGLSDSLNEMAQKEKYLALEQIHPRYDVGLDYGLLKAQLALSLAGKDREYLLSELLQFFIEKETY
jgi:UTP--glucose-1-phosphate uridylyltransferase